MNVYRKLKELKETGLLSDEFQGNQHYFFINHQNPLLKEYKRIILKDIGFEKTLSEKLKEIEGFKEAYLFGSYAKGQLSSTSDIDLLAIGDFNTVDLQKVIVDIQKTIHKEINCIELSPKEFQEKMKNRDPFLLDIMTKKYIRIE